jgi:hypothetical protein
VVPEEEETRRRRGIDPEEAHHPPIKATLAELAVCIMAVTLAGVGVVPVL